MSNIYFLRIYRANQLQAKLSRGCERPIPRAKSLLPSTACSNFKDSCVIPVQHTKTQPREIGSKVFPPVSKSDTFKEATWPTPHIPLSPRRVCAEEALGLPPPLHHPPSSRSFNARSEAVLILSTFLKCAEKTVIRSSW